MLQHALMRTWDHWENHAARRAHRHRRVYEADRHPAGRALASRGGGLSGNRGGDRGRQITERMFKALTDTLSGSARRAPPDVARELADIVRRPKTR